MPAGPSCGPPQAGEAGYEEMPYDEPEYDLSDANVIDVSAADLRKAAGPARQYDFLIPPPPQEVKVAAMPS